METAEVVNISLEWFPVQCTLRLSFFNRVAIYMMLPLLAITIPVVLVACCGNITPCLHQMVAKRKQQRRTESMRCTAINNLVITLASIVLGESTAEAEEMFLAADDVDELAQLQDDYDALCVARSSATLRLLLGCGCGAPAPQRAIALPLTFSPLAPFACTVAHRCRRCTVGRAARCSVPPLTHPTLQVWRLARPRSASGDGKGRAQAH